VRSASFDSEALTLMGRALDEAWREAQEISVADDAAEIKSRMAERIMSAAANGERDIGVLKQIALSVLT
jgi:hypothetical protein